MPQKFKSKDTNEENKQTKEATWLTRGPVQERQGKQERNS